MTAALHERSPRAVQATLAMREARANLTLLDTADRRLAC